MTDEPRFTVWSSREDRHQISDRGILQSTCYATRTDAQYRADRLNAGATTPATAAPSIWIATCNSRHFTFEGVARSSHGAYAALHSALRAHALQYQLAADPGDDGNPVPWADMMIAQAREDGAARELHIGAGYRDGALINCV